MWRRRQQTALAQGVTVPAKRILMVAERTLVVIGVACLTWYGYVTIEAAQYQREQVAAFEQALKLASASWLETTPATAGDPVPHVAPVAALSYTEVSLEESPTPRGSATAVAPAAAFPLKRPPLKLPDPNMIGILEIPRLKLSAVVASGDDPQTLKVAAGHLRDTPRPWESGNSAIAAHRDSHFRPLKQIRVGDEVRMRTTHGDFVYRVRDMKIVKPTDLSVLRPTPEDVLTLITCYPFNYIGAAPKRYIVRAERVAVAGAGANTSPTR
jgi:sortase A